MGRQPPPPRCHTAEARSSLCYSHLPPASSLWRPVVTLPGFRLVLAQGCGRRHLELRHVQRLHLLQLQLTLAQGKQGHLRRVGGAVEGEVRYTRRGGWGVERGGTHHAGPGVRVQEARVERGQGLAKGV